jgi:hypothetical protein
MSFLSQEITASGGTVNPYVFGQTLSLSIFSSGAITLAASFDITPSTDVSGATFRVRWNADVTLSTFSVTICGKKINQDQVNQTGTFDCYYDGSAWSVQYFADGTDLPQQAQGVTAVAVPTSGTLTLVAGVDTTNQRLVGSPTTLVAGYNVTASTTGVKAGSTFVIEIGGGVTIGANAFTVFGITISASQALNGGVFVNAVFDGSVWRGIQSSLPVNVSDLTAQAALTVVANATNASASPTAFAFGTDGGVLQRSGTSLVTSLLTDTNFSASLGVLKKAEVSVSSAAILTGFASPVSIVAAPGAGLINIPVFWFNKCNYGTTTYLANLNGSLYNSGGAAAFMTISNLLANTSTIYRESLITAFGTASSRAVENAAIVFQVETGNPTTGDGTIDMVVYYITLAS